MVQQNFLYVWIFTLFILIVDLDNLISYHLDHILLVMSRKLAMAMEKFYYWWFRMFNLYVHPLHTIY